MIGLEEEGEEMGGFVEEVFVSGFEDEDEELRGGVGVLGKDSGEDFGFSVRG